jgi:membrane associated rhomboid family serine protease
MGIYDRDYLQDDYRSSGHRTTQFAMPSLPPVVKWLLIINIGIYLISIIIPAVGEWIYSWGSVHPKNWAFIAQIWRLVTYQFLHDLRYIGHLFFNMLMLFFFGPLLERRWGSRRFLTFYLCAGAAGGVVYTLLVLFDVLQPLPMIGASGALYGIFGAVAVMYPHLRVYLFGLVPMSMRATAILAVAMSLLFFMRGNNAGGEAAHLTGIVVGVLYVLFQPLLTDLRLKKKKGSWSQKQENERMFMMEVDRILDKINKQGLMSLTSEEKEILREATRREQEQLRR